MLREIGVSPANNRTNSDNRNNSSDLNRLSILLSACSLVSQESSHAISPEQLNHKSPSREELMGVMSCFPNSEGRIPKAHVAEYAHMAIELFSACMTIRDHRIHSEAAAGWSALISLIANQMETSGQLLNLIEESQLVNEWPELVYGLFPILGA